MKLYTSTNSPFSARIRLAARVKGVDLEFPPLPEGGLRSDAFLALNPISKIPVLVTEDGQKLAESMVILRYLEDRFPHPSLWPEAADDRARANLVVTVLDTYVMTPIIRLFPHLAPEGRDERVVEAETAAWRSGLANLAHFFGDGVPAAEGPLSIVDCALPVSLHLGSRIAAMLGLPDDPMQAHENLSAYYARMKQDALVGPVLGEMTESQRQYDLKAGRPSVAHVH